MSENFKGRSIFDVVAERRKRSRILSSLDSVTDHGAEEDESAIGESAETSVEEPEIIARPAQVLINEDQPTKDIVNQGDEEESVIAPALQTEEPDEDEVSPLPQISSDIESLVDSKALEESEVADSALDEDSPAEIAQIEGEGETDEKDSDKESTEVLAASLSLKEAASEIADEEIDASISKEVVTERSEDDTEGIRETVEALDPIIDLSLLPKSRPNRILKKTSKSDDAPRKKPKASPTKATASKSKKKSKRVTLLDSYFSDL